MAVDAGLSVKMCIHDGRVEINGWNRSELRVFVKNGSRFALRVLEKDGASGLPNWVLVSRAAVSDPEGVPAQDCLSGESIEIDAPVGASFRVEGRASETVVDSVRKVYVRNVEGNISLRNITGGITASTYQGDVAVENSSGAIAVESANGNIAAYGVAPGQIGDLFRVKTTSGAISLRHVEHRQIEASSITGSLLFGGKLLAGGIYNFKTSNGSIRMLIPDTSSLTVKAVYGFGSFDTEIPMKVVTENVTPSAKIQILKHGSGDANVNLTTSSGSINIRKQLEP